MNEDEEEARPRIKNLTLWKRDKSLRLLHVICCFTKNMLKFTKFVENFRIYQFFASFRIWAGLFSSLTCANNCTSASITPATLTPLTSARQSCPAKFNLFSNDLSDYRSGHGLQWFERIFYTDFEGRQKYPLDQLCLWGSSSITPNRILVWIQHKYAYQALNFVLIPKVFQIGAQITPISKFQVWPNWIIWISTCWNFHCWNGLCEIDLQVLQCKKGI